MPEAVEVFCRVHDADRFFVCAVEPAADIVAVSVPAFGQIREESFSPGAPELLDPINDTQFNQEGM